VIDSETTGGALGLLLLAAAAAARGGPDLDGVAETILASRRSLRFWFYVDTLEYLRRGGRIGKAQAWLGGTLRIRPILSLGYEIEPVEKVRTRGRAIERMLTHAAELADAGCDGWTVQHIQAPEQARELVERCREIFGCEPMFVSELGPVVGTYAGPGLFGVGALPRGLLVAAGD
jgi:DegV family protein with EDD domain